jgi:hypothetical protein
MNRWHVMLGATVAFLGLAALATAGSKVTICHLGSTIEVDESSVENHLTNHNDTLGACDASPSQ